MMNFFRFLVGLMITPKTGTSEADSAGQLEVLSSDNKLRYHNGSSSSPVVTEAHTATLTNKTLTTPVINTGVSGTAIDTDGTLAANSDTLLASQKAVKTYVDSSAGSVQADVDDLITLSGVPANSDDLGTFTGAIIPDNSTIKEALQALEDEADTVAQEVTDLIVLSGVPANSLNLGTFTGSTIPDNSDNKEALQALETGLDTHTGSTAAHGATGAVVGTTNTQTLTNKTLTAPVINSPTGLVKADVGLGNVDNTSDATKNAAVATLTNKTLTAPILNSPSIVTPSRADVKQDTKANLLTYAATATNGQLVFATDEKKMYQVIDNGLAEVGGGGQSPEVFVQLVADEEISDWATGDNATFLGGGTLSGTFVKETTNPLNGDASYKYTQAAGSQNDYLASPVQDVPIRFRGTVVTLSFPYLYDGNNNDIAAVVYDVTNTQVLNNTSLSGIQASGNNASPYILNVFIPITCTQIRVGFQTLVANSGKILQFDDIQMGSNAYVAQQVANLGTSVTFTPTGTWTTNTTYTGEYRQVGDKLEVTTLIVLSGAPTAVALKLNPPTGFTFNSTKAPANTRVGTAYLNDSSAASGNTEAAIIVDPTDTTKLELRPIGSNSVTNTLPFTWATSDSIRLEYSVYVNGITPYNPTIVMQPETFNTDTATLTYSSTYTLSTLANAPVGTFITFTYASSTNTRTQTTTAPTQTTADMNSNGIQIFTRAYNAASTAGSPAAIAIQIGKGMKGVTNNLYKSKGKTTGGELDCVINSTASQRGIPIKDYNEMTGILIIDAGYAFSTALTDSQFLFSDISGQTNGYLTINASKNPALTGIGASIVAARAVNTAGTSIPNSGENTLVYDSAKTFDTHNALNTTTGVYTTPEAGYYKIDWFALFASASYTAGDQIYSVLKRNGTTVAFGEYSTLRTTAAYVVSTHGSDALFLNKNDTVTIALFNNRTGGATTLSTIVGAVHFSIVKVNVG